MRARQALGDLGHALEAWAAGESSRVPEALEPLTSTFRADQHQTYVDLLNAAVDGDGVRNIALTGRYGSGKSSVLEQFARQPDVRRRTLFLGLSTLGPADAIDTKTNQIEKELVKQLLHRERPSRLPQSRYQRIEALPSWRAAIEAALLLVSIGVALWLFGIFPQVPGFHSKRPAWQRDGAAVLVAAAVWFALTSIRLAVHNRYTVSQISAAGASISLAKSSDSYFDQYLDEIVYFFETVDEVDIVIFEDLDRFNDPGIFEALRELNTLLNNSKQMGSRSIRFVYALRDSIFEQLGIGSQAEGDSAQAEASLANRTKFFDLVVPIVPFITHRTARDLLTDVLKPDVLPEGTAVSPELIDLTARHLPDMRLLKNIRNEYLVFARRLISAGQGVQDLDPDKLFALIVYKQVYLKDFELILLGGSNLDHLYRQSRAVIAASSSTRRMRLRRIDDGLALHDRITADAENWGQQLSWFVDHLRNDGPRTLSLGGYEIADQSYDADDVTTPDFWRHLLDTDAGVEITLLRPGSAPQRPTLSRSEIERLLGQTLPADDWEGANVAELTREADRIARDLDALRTADFSDLIRRSDFTTTPSAGGATFGQIVEEIIDSELGRALIREGFIDRYYTLYVAQYYGERVPPAAMNFIVQHVDTNTPDATYPFENDAEIVAVLRETNRSFLADVSAYNINLLDYLLRNETSSAELTLDTLCTRGESEERAFLEAYLVQGTQSAAAIAYLARVWPDIFDELVDAIALPKDVTRQLLNVAMANANPDIAYGLNRSVRTYLETNYAKLAVLTRNEAAISPSSAEPVVLDSRIFVSETAGRFNAVNLLVRAGVVCDDLSALHETTIDLLVKRHAFKLTASNLRLALADPQDLSLDEIRRLNEDIYQDLLANPAAYLAALDADLAPPRMEPISATTEASSADGVRGEGVLGSTTGQSHGGKASDTPDARPRLTQWAIKDTGQFATILNEATEAGYSTEKLVELINRSDPHCVVTDLKSVVDSTWEALAQCRRFAVTLTNVAAIIRHKGEVDASLAAILREAGAIEVETPIVGPSSRDDAKDADLEDDEIDDDQTTESLEASQDGLPDEESDLDISKEFVAEHLLNARASLPDPDLRVILASSLNLDKYLLPTAIAPEHGPLLGGLIRHKICADNIAVFEHFGTDNWATLHYAVQQSAKFPGFITPELIDTATTVLLLRTRTIPIHVKRAIVGRFDEFIAADDRAALEAAGQAALADDIALGASQLTAIASGTHNPDLTLRLLNRDKELSVDDALGVLGRLNPPYADLSDPDAGQLTFPRDDPHEQLLKRLRDAKRITTRAYSATRKRPARIEATTLAGV